MRTVVFWGDAPLAAAQAKAATGVPVVRWSPGASEPVEGLRTAAADPQGEARVAAAVERWASALGAHPALGETSFAELLLWNDVALWPELRRFLLSPESAGSRCVRALETFTMVFESDLPDEVEAVGLGEDDVRLLERVATARGVLFQGDSWRRPSRPLPKRDGWGLRDRVSSWRASLRSGPKPASGGLVFARPPGDDELAEPFERLLRVAREEMSLPGVVVGGEDGLAAEALLDATARDAAGAADTAFTRRLAELKDAPSTAEAFRHEGVSFADLAAEADLTLALRRVLPAVVRRAEGVRALLRAAGPKALCATAADALALRAAELENVPAEIFAAAKDGPRVLLALERAVRGAGVVG